MAPSCDGSLYRDSDWTVTMWGPGVDGIWECCTYMIMFIHDFGCRREGTWKITSSKPLEMEFLVGAILQESSAIHGVGISCQNSR